MFSCPRCQKQYKSEKKFMKHDCSTKSDFSDTETIMSSISKRSNNSAINSTINSTINSAPNLLAINTLKADKQVLKTECKRLTSELESARKIQSNFQSQMSMITQLDTSRVSQITALKTENDSLKTQLKTQIENLKSEYDLKMLNILREKDKLIDLLNDKYTELLNTRESTIKEYTDKMKQQERDLILIIDSQNTEHINIVKKLGDEVSLYKDKYNECKSQLNYYKGIIEATKMDENTTQKLKISYDHLEKEYEQFKESAILALNTQRQEHLKMVKDLKGS